MRDVAKRTKAAVIGILESKLILDPEIYIENYEILRFDKNRHEEGVACYFRSGISYELNSFLPNEIENITFHILMPHTKPITIEIIYRPRNQSKLLDNFEENLLYSTQTIVKFTSKAISKLIFLKMEIMLLTNLPVITKPKPIHKKEP